MMLPNPHMMYQQLGLDPFPLSPPAPTLEHCARTPTGDGGGGDVKGTLASSSGGAAAGGEGNCALHLPRSPSQQGLVREQNRLDKHLDQQRVDAIIKREPLVEGGRGEEGEGGQQQRLAENAWRNEAALGGEVGYADSELSRLLQQYSSSSSSQHNDNNNNNNDDNNNNISSSNKRGGLGRGGHGSKSLPNLSGFYSSTVA